MYINVCFPVQDHILYNQPVREESGVGLLTTHGRLEPGGLAEGKAEAEVGAGIPVAGGRVQTGLGA